MYYFVKNFYFVKILICRAIYSLEASSEKTLDLFLDVFSGHLMMLIVPKRFLRSPFPSSSNKCSLKKKKKNKTQNHTTSKLETTPKPHAPEHSNHALQPSVSEDERCLQLVPDYFPLYSPHKERATSYETAYFLFLSFANINTMQSKFWDILVVHVTQLKACQIVVFE